MHAMKIDYGYSSVLWLVRHVVVLNTTTTIRQPVCKGTDTVEQ